MVEYDQNIDLGFGFGTAVALVRSDGVPIIQSDLFRRHFGPAAIDRALVRRVAKGSKHQIALSHDGLVEGERPPILAYGSIDDARKWRLPDTFLLPDEPHNGQVVVLGIVPAARCDWMRVCCQLYGFSDIQTQVTMALLAHGDIRTAAKSSGIAYGTAREAHRAVMQKLGVDSTPAMVTMLTAHSLGADLTHDDSAGVLAELYGLSQRQLALVTLISDGMSRAEAAKIIGVSAAVAKKELEAAYDCLGVSSATMLAHVVAEARTLALLTATVQIERLQKNAGSASVGDTEPLAMIDAPGGRQLAYSDYGPAGAPPVLVLHSSMNNRPVFRPLVESLQRKGFRVLALDRPGYGLSDPVESSQRKLSDPFTAAAEDIIWFCQALGLPKISIVVRSTAPVVFALQQLRPKLINRLVLLNPDNFPAQDTHKSGFFARAKYAVWSRPWLAEAAIKSALRFVTPALGKFAILRSVKGSPSDEVVMADERNRNDYLRAASMAARGKITGMIAEYIALAKLIKPEPVPGTRDWTVLIGATDFMYSSAEVHDAWSQVLPDATFHILGDGGRLLAFSHADLIAELLSQNCTPLETPQMGISVRANCANSEGVSR